MQESTLQAYYLIPVIAQPGLFQIHCHGCRTAPHLKLRQFIGRFASVESALEQLWRSPIQITTCPHCSPSTSPHTQTRMDWKVETTDETLGAAS